MKTLIKITLIFVLSINNNFYSQHLKVEYERSDLNEDYDINQSKEFNDKKSQVRKIPMKLFLYYADGYSLFKSIPRNSFTNNAGDIQKDESRLLFQFVLSAIHFPSEHVKAWPVKKIRVGEQLIRLENSRILKLLLRQLSIGCC